MIRRTLKGGLVAAVSLLAFLPTAAGAVTAGAAAPQAPGATARHHRTHPARHHHIHRFTVPGVPLRSTGHRVASPATGRVVTHGTRLNVRSGPGTGYRVIGHRHAYRTVRLACRTHGSWVRGNRVWYRLPHHRGYVSARYVRPYRTLPWC
ncbi:hypothetical protein SAMN05428944_7161 [Streptomyces sp. 1222.5]|uniref:SH3 domain-containing protein n=1 Tax=unclassified Streptomyces TaxID=2593676 RepID=UPI0008968429|nr:MULTISPECIES: SH3 domain-containing protein [unclassified Streptomyces]PKW05805.1 hypothetical protein BX260_0931 [Streptomyces sp. 5112.2]SED28161.1 hypothetical protein SAMN05428944_7161 [Streptomyces sp. 1222.5]